MSGWGGGVAPHITGTIGTVPVSCTSIALLQDPSLGYSVLGVLLATATAVLGSQVLRYDYYHDHWLVLFCLVLCSCQYR